MKSSGIYFFLQKFSIFYEKGEKPVPFFGGSNSQILSVKFSVFELY